MAGDAGEGRTPYPNAAINDVEIFADRFIVEVRWLRHPEKWR